MRERAWLLPEFTAGACVADSLPGRPLGVGVLLPPNDENMFCSALLFCWLSIFLRPVREARSDATLSSELCEHHTFPGLQKQRHLSRLHCSVP